MVVVLHGAKIFQLDFTIKKIDREKDFIIINYTRGTIIVIEVKTNLGALDSIQKSYDQLSNAKKILDSWFDTELDDSWTFIPLIFCKKTATGQNFCSKCLKYIIRIEVNDKMSEKFEQVLGDIPAATTAKDRLDQFKTICKYLIFAASTTEAPVKHNMPHLVTKEMEKNAGTVENIKLWCCWTPDQLSLMNAESLDFVLFIGAYGVGKTLLLSTRAMKLVEYKENVIFIICKTGFDEGSSLLSLSLQHKFQKFKEFIEVRVMKKGLTIEEFEKELQKIENPNEFHLIIDELDIEYLHSENRSAKLQAVCQDFKSAWIALLDNGVPGNVTTQKELFRCFREKYPLFHIPELRFTLRSHKYIAETMKEESRGRFTLGDTASVILNGELEIPPNIIQGKHF